jgi:pre-rRNA-processing protein TSR3
MAQLDLRTVIVRHPRERLAKCSLQPLVGRADMRFLTATHDFSFDATGYILLEVGAPVLSVADAGHPLLLLDSTWRLLPKLLGRIRGNPIRRALPEGVATAYPRVSKLTSDPLGGLASVEALYWALGILGREDANLLKDYHWRDTFLQNIAAWERGSRGGIRIE